MRTRTARDFLEKVLAGVCRPLNVSPERLLTDGVRARLVLASGGVARDYLSLIRIALRLANEREHRRFLPRNRITAEDVNKASQQIQAQKQEDLLMDSGADAAALRSRLDDLADFCLERNVTNVFSVENNKLKEEAWGRQIQALADLHLIHDIGSVSLHHEFRGRDFRAFTLDLSMHTGTRAERIQAIEF